MAIDLVKEVESRYLKKKLPDIRPGDTVKVKIKIKEGNKERLQAYEGVVIKLHGAGLNKTITVRRVFQGVGVERVFLLHSPKVETIQVLRKGDVRRAKLYYLRELTGKAARIREKLGAAREEVEYLTAEPEPEPEVEVVAEATPEVVAEAPAAEPVVVEEAPIAAAEPEAPIAEAPVAESAEPEAPATGE